MDYSRKEGEQEALINLDNPQGANGGDSAMVLDFLKAMKKSGGIDADFLLVNCGLHDLRIMTDASVPVIDLFTFTLNLGSYLYYDHVHFNEYVRIQQAAFIAGWLAAFIIVISIK